MNAASDNFDNDRGLEGIVGAGVAIGDLTNMWKELADVAPEEIRADTEAVAEAWEQQADRAGDMVDNPLGGLASAFGGAMKMAGPLQRVDKYIGENCTT